MQPKLEKVDDGTIEMKNLHSAPQNDYCESYEFTGTTDSHISGGGEHTGHKYMYIHEQCILILAKALQSIPTT